jgi:hypothetical protein
MIMLHERMTAGESMSRKVLSSEVKTVGKSGQISLGKSYAGKALRLERLADGRIVLTAVAVVPESQLWTLQEPTVPPSPRAWHGLRKHPPPRATSTNCYAVAAFRFRRPR